MRSHIRRTSTPIRNVNTQYRKLAAYWSAWQALNKGQARKRGKCSVRCAYGNCFTARNWRCVFDRPIIYLLPPNRRLKTRWGKKYSSIDGMWRGYSVMARWAWEPAIFSITCHKNDNKHFDASLFADSDFGRVLTDCSCHTALSSFWWYSGDALCSYLNATHRKSTKITNNKSYSHWAALFT